MIRETCFNCLFRDNCVAFDICEHYAPIDDTLYIEAMIKTNYNEFLNEWNTYINEYEADF